ncbi:peptidogalycan biosysnthesis protein [Nannocystis sp. SCPEA4]|uniref:GNAT family N-acetyltransferase n=1 Tax=Nannocystis sp. SCPEA4 TaxID=2996787 RepID=UPI00226E34A6|nr:peptidogalycan biosysnthesis protein [Nannocystis sp. SCPEA4]
MPDLTSRTVTSLASVDAASWDALAHEGCPFLNHGFLRALELSGSIGDEAGWRPVYVLVEERGAGGAGSAPRLVGAAPTYVKRHSYGEFIFDWAWARAAVQGGLRYYPKLVIAAPMTPATGPRMLVAPDVARDEIVRRLVAGVRDVADSERCWSIHWLFTTAREHDELAAHGFMRRASYQYHWHNEGYADFEAFLATMTSRRRKQLRKERARARAGIDALEWVRGPDLAPDDLTDIDRYYRATVRAYGGLDYLQPGFFEHVHKAMPEQMLWARARRGGRTIAGTLYFETDAALFGRYWGCDETVPFLHFEAAYYAAIERCIARKTPRFEAGAQGEHKLLRGFAPARTYSSHWFRHPGLASAVDRYLGEEAIAAHEQMRELEEYLPFRDDDGGDPDAP